MAMVDWMKSNPYTTAAIVGSVVILGATAAWIATRPKEVEYFNSSVRDELKDFIKQLKKKVHKQMEKATTPKIDPPKISSEDRKTLRKLMKIDVAEDSLAEKFLAKAEPVVGALLAVQSKEAVFGFSKASVLKLEAQCDELESILKKMEKAEKESGWFQRM